MDRARRPRLQVLAPDRLPTLGENNGCVRSFIVPSTPGGCSGLKPSDKSARQAARYPRSQDRTFVGLERAGLIENASARTFARHAG